MKPQRSLVRLTFVAVVLTLLLAGLASWGGGTGRLLASLTFFSALFCGFVIGVGWARSRTDRQLSVTLMWTVAIVSIGIFLYFAGLHTPAVIAGSENQVLFVLMFGIAVVGAAYSTSQDMKRR